MLLETSSWKLKIVGNLDPKECFWKSWKKNHKLETLLLKIMTQKQLSFISIPTIQDKNCHRQRPLWHQVTASGEVTPLRMSNITGTKADFNRKPIAKSKIKKTKTTAFSRRYQWYPVPRITDVFFNHTFTKQTKNISDFRAIPKGKVTSQWRASQAPWLSSSVGNFLGKVWRSKEIHGRNCDEEDIGYLPRTQIDPLFWLEKALFWKNWPSKIEVIGVLGSNWMYHDVIIWPNFPDSPETAFMLMNT